MSDPSAMFTALEAHDLDGLASVLAGGADPNALKPAPPHWSPLHEAIEQLEDGGSIEELVLLLRHGAAVEGSEGDTPLLMALYRDQPDAVRLLLGAGANPNVRGMEGTLHYASPSSAAITRSRRRCCAAAPVGRSMTPVHRPGRPRSASLRSGSMCR